MLILYIISVVAIIIVFISIKILLWAVNSGQYDDLDSPAYSILFDDDKQTFD